MHSVTNVVSLNKKREVAAMEASNKILEREQRAEHRAISGERLFVQITQASDRDLVGVTLSCKTVDASNHGIKFLVDEFIPVGCLLDLRVDDNSRPGKFFLSGNVRWTQKVGQSSTLVGVSLQDGQATDIDHWKEVHPV